MLTFSGENSVNLCSVSYTYLTSSDYMISAVDTMNLIVILLIRQEILCAKVISGSASKRAGKRARAARSMQSLFPDCLDRENRFSCAMQIDKILSRVSSLCLCSLKVIFTSEWSVRGEGPTRLSP